MKKRKITITKVEVAEAFTSPCIPGCKTYRVYYQRDGSSYWIDSALVEARDELAAATAVMKDYDYGD